jgi:hypothetical protein
MNWWSCNEPRAGDGGVGGVDRDVLGLLDDVQRSARYSLPEEQTI